jgi:hypothetical protein
VSCTRSQAQLFNGKQKTEHSITGGLMRICWSLVMLLGIALLYPSGGQGAEAVKLPPPVKTGGMSLAEALEVRRTVRRFASRPLRPSWSCRWGINLRAIRQIPGKNILLPRNKA